MKNIFIVIALALFTSCNGEKAKRNQIQENESNQSENIESMESAIAEDHTPEYLENMVKGWGAAIMDHQTADLKKTIQDVDDAAFKAGQEVGYWEADVWYENQDPEIVAPAFVGIESIKGDEAIVNLMLTQYGEKTPRQLKLVFADGTWAVHDFSGSTKVWIRDTCAKAFKEISSF